MSLAGGGDSKDPYPVSLIETFFDRRRSLSLENAFYAVVVCVFILPVVQDTDMYTTLSRQPG